MRKSDFSVLLPWRDDAAHEPKLGDGISRPRPDEHTRLFTVEVQPPGAKSLRLTTPAPSATAALTYAQNRWPQATVKLLS